MPISKRLQSGQLLIEVLIATSIFAILSAAIISMVFLMYENLINVRVKTIARHLAVSKMEMINNLAYADVGTINGIPPGDLAEFSEVNRNGFIFTIHTSVIYIDDPFDDTSPDDLLPTDYKQIRVEVSWEKQLNIYGEPIVLVSLISPKGIETTDGGGTLSVFTIDSNGETLSGASVHISNTSVIPNIDITMQTDQNGYLILPGAPVCAACYHITVTKESYSTDKTYTTDEVANPNKRPLTVSAATLTESTFIIDRFAEMTVISFSGIDEFETQANQNFRLTGLKTIGLDSEDNPVYKYDQTLSTGSSADLLITDLEWDTYVLTLPVTNGKQISGIYPHQPILIIPGSENVVKVAGVPLTAHSLLLSVKDASGSAIASASAILKQETYIATRSSGLLDQPNFGQIFFNDLNIGTYDFTLTHPDFSDLTGSALVNGISSDNLIMTNK